MLKLAVNGACGRMGQRIVTLARESGDFEIIGALERPDHPSFGQDIGLLAGLGEIGVAVTDTPVTKPDVIIDFSIPSGTAVCVDYCQKEHVALVVGTTGLSDELVGRLNQLSQKTAVLIGSNMSLGMNLLFKLVAEVAAALSDDYDIEVSETHHRFKRDAPSGSALSLAKSIAQAKGWNFPDCLVHGREGKEVLRESKTIGMHALRLGDTVGEHSVYFGALGETLELRHSAHTRDTFVRGALHAAGWLCEQKPGLYDMNAVLGL